MFAPPVNPDTVEFGSVGCQADNANAFHKPGGLNIRGLKNANLRKPQSCPNANHRTVTLMFSAFTSLKVAAHGEIKSKSLSSV